MDRARLPESLQHYFKENHSDETLHVAIASDVTKQLIYGEEWLIATDKRISTFATHNGNAEIISSHQLSDIKKVESVNLTGSGVIEILVNDRSHRLIYYSNAKNGDFAWAIEQIKMLLDGNAIEPDKHERKRRICESCGYPIPEDLNKCPRCTEKGKTLRRILQFTKPYLGQLFFIFLTLIAGIIFGLVTPYMSKLFIDVILKPDATTGVFQHAHWIPLAALALFAAYAGQNFFSGLHMRLAGIVGHRTVFDVRAAIYQKLQDLSLAFFDKHQTGALMARVNQDTRELQHFLVDFIPLSLESLFILVGVGIFLSLLSWQLTLFVFIPIIATVLFLKNIFSKIRLYFRRYYHRRSRLSALVNDSLSGMRVIKAFGQESEESKKFSSKSAAFRDAGIDLENKWSIYSPTLQLLIMSGTVLVWFVGGKLIVGGRMTLGDVVAYTGYLMMFYRPIFILTRMVQLITSSVSAAERVFDVIDTEPLVQDSPTAVPMPAIQGGIEFKNVTFGYDQFKPVIKDFNVTIQPNEIIGLIGKSGAGKSTFINLVGRLYDVNKGAILVDGIDLREIKYHDLRSQIGVVLQETFLFNGTIFENIAYAKPEASVEEVIDAAIAAHAHEFILKKPDGYDTEVGERGNRLSGGEKQRIAIARAILRDPRILILDEATSSLDTETEKKIQDALKNLTKGRTTIAIAHRLSTLRNCNRLLVIEDGKLAEIGTHEELMEKQGVFYNLVSMQTELQKIIALSE